MSGYEAKARERAAVLLRHIGGRNEALANQLVSEHTETVAAALIHSADEKLEGVLGKVEERIKRHGVAAKACHDNGRFDLWSEQLKSAEAFGQIRSWLLEALGRKE